MDSSEECPFIPFDDFDQFPGSQELKDLLQIGDLDPSLTQSSADEASKPGAGDVSPCGSPLTPEQAAPAFTTASQGSPDSPGLLVDQETSLNYENLHMDLTFFKNNMENDTISTDPEPANFDDLMNELFSNNSDMPVEYVIQPVSSNAVTSTSNVSGLIGDEELCSLSVKDLNRRLQSVPKDAAKVLKARRRTLKNRGYAANSRERRQKDRSELEADNKGLMIELEKAHLEIANLKEQCNRYKQECQRLKEQQVPSPFSAL